MKITIEPKEPAETNPSVSLVTVDEEYEPDGRQRCNFQPPCANMAEAEFVMGETTIDFACNIHAGDALLGLLWPATGD